MTVSDFIKKLDTMIETHNYRASVCEEDGRTYLHGDEITDIDYEASGLFILGGGTPDYDKMQDLRNMSNGKYWIFPGETDSFGWVTGCIKTPVGIIVYG
jgi:WD40 repeat protein